MKQIMTVEDVVLQGRTLHHQLQDAWLHNIYDGPEKGTLMLRFQLSHELEGKKRAYVFVDPGRRLYTIDSFQADGTFPGGWAAFLRKYLKGQRMTHIQYHPHDRVLDLVFPRRSREEERHIVLEMYGKGNCLVTDADYRILGMSRHHYYHITDPTVSDPDSASQHSDSDDRVHSIKPGEIYPMPEGMRSCLDDSAAGLEIDLRGYYRSGRDFGPLVKWTDRVASGDVSEGDAMVCDTLNEAMRLYWADIDAQRQVREVKNIKKSKMKNPGDRVQRQVHHLLGQVRKFDTQEQKHHDQATKLEDSVEWLTEVLSLVTEDLVDNSWKERIQVMHNRWPDHTFQYQHPHLVVDGFPLDPGLTAYQQISSIHQKRKQIAVKRGRATAKHQEVIQTVSKAKTLEKVSGSVSRVERKKWAFEKYWWLYSHGYFLLCGKSADDNESLLRNVIPTDVLVHGDFDKSPWCVVQNPDGGEVPLKVLRDAGALVVQRSWLWNEGQTHRAYYTTPQDITRTAPSGEFLGKGARMVHKKTYLPDVRMEGGVGLLFKCQQEEKITWKTHLSEVEGNIEDVLLVSGPYTALSPYQFHLKLKPSRQSKDKGRKKLLDKIRQQLGFHKDSGDWIGRISREEWDQVTLRHIRLP